MQKERRTGNCRERYIKQYDNSTALVILFEEALYSEMQHTSLLSLLQYLVAETYSLDFMNVCAVLGCSTKRGISYIPLSKKDAVGMCFYCCWHRDVSGLVMLMG
jgi:hypothetical protein